MLSADLNLRNFPDLRKLSREGYIEKHAVATWSLGNHLSIRF